MSPNWNVTVKLNDGTDTVDADLSDKVKKLSVLNSESELIQKIRA